MLVWTLLGSRSKALGLWQGRAIELGGAVAPSIDQIVVVLVHVSDVLFENLLVLGGVDHWHPHR